MYNLTEGYRMDREEDPFLDRVLHFQSMKPYVHQTDRKYAGGGHGKRNSVRLTKLTKTSTASEYSYSLALNGGFL